MMTSCNPLTPAETPEPPAPSPPDHKHIRPLVEKSEIGRTWRHVHKFHCIYTRMDATNSGTCRSIGMEICVAIPPLVKPFTVPASSPAHFRSKPSVNVGPPQFKRYVFAAPYTGFSGCAGAGARACAAAHTCIARRTSWSHSGHLHIPLMTECMAGAARMRDGHATHLPTTDTYCLRCLFSQERGENGWLRREQCSRAASWRRRGKWQLLSDVQVNGDTCKLQRIQKIVAPSSSTKCRRFRHHPYSPFCPCCLLSIFEQQARYFP